MSDLVGNPKDQFSSVTAQLSMKMSCYVYVQILAVAGRLTIMNRINFDLDYFTLKFQH